jgi:glyoxylase-like metal-dependent hydrolase (beta-lactamase superfamily II)
VSTWIVGSFEVTRIEDPGFELVLPSDEPTVAALQRSPWLQPHFVTDDWALDIGSSCIAIRAGDRTVLVDPFLAFDDPERLWTRLQALRDAGIEADDVDIVVNTHVDGIGINVLRDDSPTFPSARYLVPRAELEAMRAGRHGETRADALLALEDAGVVEPTDGREELLPGLRLADAPGHNPGMHVVWIEDGDDAAVVVGHLFLHPAQIADPAVHNGDLDPVVLEATRRALLSACVDRGALLIGPLFAPPGGGRVRADGDRWRLEVSADAGAASAAPTG